MLKYIARLYDNRPTRAYLIVLSVGLVQAAQSRWCTTFGELPGTHSLDDNFVA